MQFGALLYQALPVLPYDAKIWGRQLVMDEEDNILDEVESTIQQACDTYNASAGKEAVVLKAAKENDDHTVTVVMQYADASAYSAFNKLALFVGTVKDAFNAGYDLNVTLSSLKGDGEQIGKEDLL